MKRRFAILLVLTACLIGFARAEIPDGFYQPQEYSDNDYSNPDSRWCFARSSESAHFIAFWEAGFGEDPSNVSENMRVDIADLLEKAETFYQTNVSLGMADALPLRQKNPDLPRCLFHRARRAGRICLPHLGQRRIHRRANAV